ncbi:hypothetical protein GQ44DRAFT_770607 [Phaeosphaeriaceae sp. PMI808]|nr:hypothetical protein GQ44DRAFT_770607 [Phaeosphaeriaceae sp. PMI808]
MASINAPISIVDVVAQAGNYTYNAQIPLANWLRTASTMQKEAQVYEAEGNDAQTYLLLYRHADLVLQKLQTHPDRNQPQNKKALHAATTTVYSDLRKLETIAPRIKKRYEEYQERKRRQQDALKVLEETQEQRTERDKAAYDSRPTLDAQENQTLATRLAQREVRRRDTARRSVRQHGVSEEVEQQRRTGGRWESWQDDLAHDPNGGDLMNQLQEVARLQRNGHNEPHYSQPSSRYTYTYHYPSVPNKSTQGDLPHPSAHFGESYTAPARPPKEQIYRSSETAFDNPRPPPIPGKYTEPPTSLPPVPGKIPDNRPPTPSAELDAFSFKPSAYLENGDALRPVFLPSQLRQQFLNVASSNTRLNLETCGMLCGILKSNALFITRLVVPEQTSTSDTCETLNEEEFFDYCDKEELLVIGWIHTHPTQTCFMSSRDLHTHVGYQVMMPESIAIVCAPSKNPSWGCFRLTDPPGKQAILGCTKPGIFHPHDVDNIYTEALKPGHVVELVNAPLEIVDMRPKKKF